MENSYLIHQKKRKFKKIQIIKKIQKTQNIKKKYLLNL
jgi:hypothetical protein